MIEMTLPTRDIIRSLGILGRVGYLSVTEDPHNTESLGARKKLSFLETLLEPEQGTKLRSQTSQAGSFNHYTRTPPWIRVGLYKAQSL